MLECIELVEHARGHFGVAVAGMGIAGCIFLALFLLFLLDDLVDTGRTAKLVKEMIPKAHFATVYAKPAGRPVVDTFITEVSQDTWILFPWDAESQFVQPIVGLTERGKPK